MTMHYTILLTCVTLFAGCSSTPLSLSEDTNQLNQAGLLKIEHSKLDFSYAKPGVDWTKYTHIHVKEVRADNQHPDDYRPPHIDRKWDGLNATYDIPASALRRLETEFVDMAKNMFDQEQPWQYSDTIDDNTLVVLAVITDIRLSAPVESSRRSHTVNGKVYTPNAGSMVLKAVLTDGETGAILAESIDRAQANDNWSLNTQVFNWGDVRTIYRSWANALKNAMFQIHSANQ